MSLDFLHEDYKLFESSGVKEKLVKANTHETKYCLLYEPSINEMERFLNDAFETIKNYLLKDIEKHPNYYFEPIYQKDKSQSWGYSKLNLQFFGDFMRLDEKGFFYRAHKLKGPHAGGYGQFFKMKENYDEIFAWLKKSKAIDVINCFKNTTFSFDKGFNPLKILHEKMDVKNLINTVCAQSYDGAKHNPNSIFALKLLESMVYQNWILFPKTAYPPSLTTVFYYPQDVELKRQFPLLVEPKSTERVDFFKLIVTCIKESYSRKRFIRRTIRYFLNLILQTTAIAAKNISSPLLNKSFKVPKKSSFISAIDNVILQLMIKEMNLINKELPEITCNYEYRKKLEIKRQTNKLTTGTFEWALMEEPKLETWQRLFHEYTITNKKNKNIKQIAGRLNEWLSFLLEMNEEELCRALRPEDIRRDVHIIRYNYDTKSNALRTTFYEYIETKFIEQKKVDPRHANLFFSEIEAFFRWYARKINPLCTVPIIKLDRFFVDDQLYKTAKLPIPTKLYKLMKKIIIKKNYAWPKKLSDDWTGKKIGKGMWCPCRAVLTELLLTLPIRFDSAVSADSGYADEYIYDHKTKTFIKNNKGEIGRRFGIFRKLEDSVLEDVLIGFYFTSDKSHKDGLTVKWDNAKLRKKILRVIRFNEKIGMHRIYDRHAAKHCTEPTKRDNHVIYPLFIDHANPTISARTTPVSRNRYEKFFLYLLAETEKRFNKNLSNAENPVKLITKWKINKDGIKTPEKAIFTPHCTRVTGITNFALAGIPPLVIAEFLSGHSSVLMNLYYTKFGVSLITKMITGAVSKIQSTNDLISMEDFINDRKLAELIFYAQTDEGYDQASSTHPQLWQISKGYICPNGGTMCDVGSIPTFEEELSPKSFKNYKPNWVIGGKGNCALCRFSLTGPMLLDQLVLAANQLMHEIIDMNGKGHKLEKEIRELNRGGESISARIKQSELEQHQLEIQTKVYTWVATYKMACKAYLKNPMFKLIENYIIEGRSKADIKKLIENGKHEFALLGKNFDDTKLELSIRDDNSEVIIPAALAGSFSTINDDISANLKLGNMILKSLMAGSIDASKLILNLSEEQLYHCNVLMTEYLGKLNYIHTIKEYGRTAIADDKHIKEFSKLLNGGDIIKSLENESDSIFFKKTIEELVHQLSVVAKDDYDGVITKDKLMDKLSENNKELYNKVQMLAA